MNNSSAQQNYSITLDDTTTTIDTLTFVNGVAQDTYSSYSIGPSDDVITITSGTGLSYTNSISSGAGGPYTYTISGAGAGVQAVTLGEIDPVIFQWKNQEFVDCFPDFDRIKQMCNEYPGLKIAFEKFAATYRLVKDDYDTPPEKRIKP